MSADSVVINRKEPKIRAGQIAQLVIGDTCETASCVLYEDHRIDF